MCHIWDIRGMLLAKIELFLKKPKILFYSKLITIQGFGNKVEIFRLYLHKQRFSFLGTPRVNSGGAQKLKFFVYENRDQKTPLYNQNLVLRI